MEGSIIDYFRDFAEKVAQGAAYKKNLRSADFGVADVKLTGCDEVWKRLYYDPLAQHMWFDGGRTPVVLVNTLFGALRFWPPSQDVVTAVKSNPYLVKKPSEEDTTEDRKRVKPPVDGAK